MFLYLLSHPGSFPPAECLSCITKMSESEPQWRQFKQIILLKSDKHTQSLTLYLLSFLFLFLSLIHSDSSFYRHIFSQLGVKLTFLPTSSSHAWQWRCQILLYFLHWSCIFFMCESWPWCKFPLLFKAEERITHTKCISRKYTHTHCQLMMKMSTHDTTE